MGRACFLALMMGLHILPAAAQGQSRIPDPAAVPRDVEESEQAGEAQRVMKEYGACIVKKARRRAEAALTTFPNSKEFGQAMVKLASSECLMTGELRFKPILLRGSLFEALYNADFGSRPVDVTAVPAIDYFAGAEERESPGVRRQVAIRQFADCISRANPAGVHALILSRVGSDGETDGFRQVMPTASQCLTEGVELKLSRPILRGLVAETMYRLSQAARSASLTR